MTKQPRSERFKAALAGSVGLLATVVALAAGPWQLALLIGCSTAAATVLADVWREIAGLDAEATKRVSTREDDSRNTTRLLVVTACVGSLAAVLIGLHHASRVGRAMQIALIVGSLLTVVLSWLLVHTLFTVRYAHLYYGGDRGIDFPGGEAPRYSDFAYVAFTVGMTFQVSDTSLTTTSMRRTGLRHAVLSYLFGTAIVASTISVLAGFVV